jgi:antitoxin component YwqK of YwqJK toxin-antitoxin module
MNIQFSKKIVLLLFLISSVIFAQDNINQVDEKGNKHGIWKGVYEDTKYPKYEGQFNHGKEVGVFTFYDNTKVKKIVATRDFSAKDGSCYTIVFNGKHKVSEGKLVNKLHEGEWKFYHLRSDTIMNLENYKKGKLHGVKKVFYNTGLIAEETNFVEGIKNGPYKKVAENGVILEETNFKNGELNGPAIFREAAGDKYTIGEYKNGQSVGIWKFYDKGKLVKEENRSEKKKAKPKTAKGEAKRKVKAQKQ